MGVPTRAPHMAHLLQILGTLLVIHILGEMCSCIVLWDTYNKVCDTHLIHSVVQTTSLSEISCCSKCHLNSWCKSLSFKPSSQECQLSDINCKDVGPASVGDKEWITFVKTGTPCIDFLVSGPNGINDGQLSATSAGYSHTAEHARLNTAGFWAQQPPTTTDAYVQADFLKFKVITGFALQGRPTETGYTQFVTRFRVLTSLDCFTFTYIVDDSNGVKVFNGNSHPDKTVTRYPQLGWVLARCVRINPVAWIDWPTLRFDVLGF